MAMRNPDAAPMQPHTIARYLSDAQLLEQRGIAAMKLGDEYMRSHLYPSEHKRDRHMRRYLDELQCYDAELERRGIA